MERLKAMKESLMGCVEGQIHGHLSEVDAKELGEAVDMIKDLSEAIYYCTITEAMEKGDKESQYQSNGREVYHYTEKYYPDFYPDYYRPVYPPYANGKENGGNGNTNRVMYYTDSGMDMNSTSGNSTNRGSNGRYPVEIRDEREGRSPMSRRNYMESKEMHKDKNTQMQELEEYMKELTEDITEMISDATPEEKTLLQQKLNMLATKIK